MSSANGEDTAPSCGAIDVVLSPLAGEVQPLSASRDAVFASGSLGPGVTIEPAEGVVTAPFDGTVTALYPSCHAIGVTSHEGTECLVHVGVGTVNLGGQHFTVHVAQGDVLSAGDVLLTFDRDAIMNAGYALDSAVVVTNASTHLDVFPVIERGLVARGDELIKTIS